MGTILYCAIVICGAAISGYIIGNVFTKIILADLHKRGKF
jgi:hypothetical protein